MSERYVLALSEPASGFTESFLLGNGRLGASIRGGIGQERIDLNLDTLWSGGPLGHEPGDSPAHLLPPLRAAIADKDYLGADTLGEQIQGPGWTQSYQPLGALKLGYAQAGKAQNYLRTLDLRQAEARSTYATEAGTVSLVSLVSAPADVLLCVIEGSAALAFDGLTLDFETQQLHAEIVRTQEDGTTFLRVSGRAPANVLPNYVRQEPAIVYGEDTPDAAGTVAAGMGYGLVAALQRGPAGEARIFAAAESGFKGFDQRPSADVAALLAKAEARVRDALRRGTSDIVAEHRKDYRRFFDRTDLDLSLSKVTDTADPYRAELLYHYGRYLLISGSRPGTQPTNLQGLWNVDLRPAWSCNYTININTEMNYWPAEMTGLGDLAQPLYQFVLDASGERGRQAARHYYGFRGATAHHNTDIWHFSAPVHGEPHWANWPSGLIWLAAHLREHIDFQPQDKAFVSQFALPVWREAVAFALDLLVAEPDGSLVASPSTAPENRFLIGGGQSASISKGTTMDQELIHELLINYLAFETDRTSALFGEAEGAFQRLRLPGVLSNGAILEWEDAFEPVELGHRHLSHLYGLHPGQRITEAGNPQGFSAIGKALDVRLENGTGHTGWSQAWLLCYAARLRDPMLAERAIHGLLNDLAFKSLMVLHPHTDWEEGNVFQIDGNFGAVAGMTELLVQSQDGPIALLRALPPSWPSGSAKGIRVRGGHVVDIEWRDGRLSSLAIEAALDGTLELEWPDVTGPSRLNDGHAALEEKPARLGGTSLFEFQVNAGTRYAFTFGS